MRARRPPEEPVFFSFSPSFRERGGISLAGLVKSNCSKAHFYNGGSFLVERKYMDGEMRNCRLSESALFGRTTDRRIPRPRSCRSGFLVIPWRLVIRWDVSSPAHYGRSHTKGSKRCSFVRAAVASLLKIYRKTCPL